MINVSIQLERLVKQYFEKKNLPLDIALTFSDVVIRDNFSSIDSRSDIKNLKAHLAREIYLNIPIVSANMDTVTDSRLAIALARLGGLGFVHQFFSLEDRLLEVEKVKRADNAVIDEPVTILPDIILKEAKEVMDRYQVSSALVTDKDRQLLGILTVRDYHFKTDDSLPVAKIMKPMPLVVAGPDVTRKEVIKIFDQSKFEKLPLVDKKNRVVGLMCAKDIAKERAFPDALRDRKGRLMVGVAIRLNADYLKETAVLIAAGTDVILLDTARANSQRVRESAEKIKRKFPRVPLVVGNIDTPEAALLLIKAGVDCLKVGIGPGSACKTREAAGVGIPQITAVAACAAVAKKYAVPIIADGGIKGGSDLSKALVAGADTVMIGSLFAGTDESPGEVFIDGGQRYKMYRGSASAEHQFERRQAGSLEGVRAPEGVPRRVLHRGPLQLVVGELIGGLRSSMSYVGAPDLASFQKIGKFVRQTNSGLQEGKPQE